MARVGQRRPGHRRRPPSRRRGRGEDRGNRPMSELQFRDTAAAGYDRSVGDMTRRIVPALLGAARLAPGQRVLDIATGTGLAAEAAADAVGPTGRVVAADISPAMLDRARERLGTLPNVSFAVEDGQDLGFPAGCFDVVIC